MIKTVFYQLTKRLTLTHHRESAAFSLASSDDERPFYLGNYEEAKLVAEQILRLIESEEPDNANG